MVTSFRRQKSQISREVNCHNSPVKRVGLIVAFSALLLTSCTTKTVAVSDISAAQIKLPIVHSNEIPNYHRVVALANGAAEIVAALGFTSILVGRDIASTMPELAKVPIDTAGHAVSIEKVLQQKPDLIIIDQNTTPQSALTTLANSGIKVMKIADAFNLQAIVGKENAIAAAIGTPVAGALLVKQVNDAISPKRKITVAFLYLRGTASIYLIGGKGSGADSMLSAMGFTDVGAQNLKLPFNALSAEELIKLRPDVLLLMTKGLTSVGGLSGLAALPGIAQTPAGQHGRVVTVDDSLLLSFGPRTVPLLTPLRAAILKAATK